MVNEITCIRLLAAWIMSCGKVLGGRRLGCMSLFRITRPRSITLITLKHCVAEYGRPEGNIYYTISNMQSWFHFCDTFLKLRAADSTTGTPKHKGH